MSSRQFHRWVGIVAAILFLSVSITGIVLQCQQLFGEDEARKEALALAFSPQNLNSPLEQVIAVGERARRTVAAKYGDLPVAEIDWEFKGDQPFIVFHLDGTDPLRVVVAAKTAQIVKVEPDAESWLLRLHTGEILGDGGMFLGLLWGLALVAMTITGFQVYWRMVRARMKNARTTGLKRWFWLITMAIMSLGSPAHACATPGAGHQDTFSRLAGCALFTEGISHKEQALASLREQMTLDCALLSDRSALPSSGSDRRICSGSIGSKGFSAP